MSQRLESIGSPGDRMNTAENFSHDKNSQWVTASFGTRALALFVDSVVFFMIFSSINISLAFAGIPMASLGGLGFSSYSFGASFLYYGVVPYFCGSTFGKYIFHLRIIHKDGHEKLGLLQLFFREVPGRFLSVYSFGIGYFLALTDKKCRTLHDVLGSTLVVQEVDAEFEEKLSISPDIQIAS